MATTELDPDEKAALNIQRILTRAKNRQLRKCLSKPEWEALLFGVADQFQPLIRRLAVYHRAIPEDSVCPRCGRRKGDQ